MLSDNDLELLSAYIDGALNESERAALETRLAVDAELRRELARLRATVELVNALPTLAAPRDFTLTPRMVRRPPTILTSPVFSALSAAAAVLLLVVGTALFASSVRLPEANLTANQVALAPTSEPLNQLRFPDTATGDLQDGLQAGADETALERAEGELAQATSSPQPLGMMQATSQAQEAPLDLITAPTGSPAESQFYAVPESATLAEEQDDFAGALASDAAANQQEGETRLADEPSQQPENAAGAAMPFTTEAQPAPVEAPMVAQAFASATPAPTTSPTGTPSLTPSATPSPTETLTATVTSSPVPLPTLTATPQPSVFGVSGAAGIGVGLIVAALVLLVAAVVTTILRRGS